MQEKVSAQYKNEIEMAKAQRDFELKKAAYDIEVNTKKAESEMAYQLQVANDIQLGFQLVIWGLPVYFKLSRRLIFLGTSRNHVGLGKYKKNDN